VTKFEAKNKYSNNIDEYMNFEDIIYLIWQCVSECMCGVCESKSQMILERKQKLFVMVYLALRKVGKK
jgi:hypothetical protein